MICKLLLSSDLHLYLQVLVTGRPIIPTTLTHFLGFYVPSGNIPFSNDDNAEGIPNKVYRVNGAYRPSVNDTRYALGSSGEKIKYSIGAITDPSELGIIVFLLIV